MYYLNAGQHQHRRLRNALLVALAVHAALFLGIRFERDRAAERAPQIEITLATRPAQAPPDSARHAAQFDQRASGEAADRPQVTTRHSAPALDSLPLARSRALRPEQRASAAQHTLLATAAAHRAPSRERVQRELELEQLQGISPEVAQLSRELASLEAELDEQTRTYADRPRVRRLTSLAARQAADAAYLLDWRRRVEAVGNKYYPEASVRYGIYGDLRMLVVIDPNGRLDDIRILSSSGYAVLDEAAIKIVRMAAPFAPFPDELKATTDRLEIIRTWQFQENRLSSD
ncbi:MAG: energy transducer TonB [Halioglobus sp.]|nr:energy transducer TonB [Halioglobus sp.]